MERAPRKWAVSLWFRFKQNRKGAFHFPDTREAGLGVAWFLQADVEVSDTPDVEEREKISPHGWVCLPGFRRRMGLFGFHWLNLAVPSRPVHCCFLVVVFFWGGGVGGFRFNDPMTASEEYLPKFPLLVSIQKGVYH